jgi:probable F420-dependent oxidoreductase
MPSYSVTIVATDQSISVIDFARAVEERDLDGLWLPDHTHMPVDRSSPYPMGGELPERYRRNVDPLIGLGLAAAVTSRIRVGTGVLLAAVRDPIVTAKALATLDQQSNGRVAVGVGFGWNREEIADHGVDPATRRACTREHVLAMRALWENEVGKFDGRYVQFSPSWSWPKPVQERLPILIGGAPTRQVFDHIADYATGWIPLGGRGLAEAVPRLRELVAAAGRDPEALEIVPFTSAEADHDKVDALERNGATEVAFEIHSGGRDDVLTELDQIAHFVGRRRASGRSTPG